MPTCGIHGADTSSGRCATCDRQRRPDLADVFMAEADAAEVVHVDVAPGEDPDAVAERVGAALDAADPSGKRPVSMSVQVGDGPAVTIISSAEVLEQGGTLDARYWVHRLPGESVNAYRHRMAIQDVERRAVRHEAQAAALRMEAAEMRQRGVPQ